MPIPTVAAAEAALAPYLLWLRLAAIALMVALIFGAGWRAGSRLTEYRWQRAAAKQAADYQASLAQAREAEKRSYAQRDEVSNALQRDLATIRADRDRLRALPARVVRVYVPAARPASLPADGRPAPGRDGTIAGTAPPAGTPGPDIGRGLYDLVDDGDSREAELRARMDACRTGWATAAGQ